MKQGPSVQSDQGRKPGALSCQVDTCFDLAGLPASKESVLDRRPGDWTEEPRPKGSDWPDDHVTIPGQAQNKGIIQMREEEGQHVSAKMPSSKALNLRLLHQKWSVADSTWLSQQASLRCVRCVGVCVCVCVCASSAVNPNWRWDLESERITLPPCLEDSSRV